MSLLTFLSDVGLSWEYSMGLASSSIIPRVGHFSTTGIEKYVNCNGSQLICAGLACDDVGFNFTSLLKLILVASWTANTCTLRMVDLHYFLVCATHRNENDSLL